MLSLETIHFSNELQALLAHVQQETPADDIVAALKVPQPRGVISLNGGTAELDEILEIKLRLLLVDGLARFAAENVITLVTGGTDAGVFSLLGEGLAKWGRRAPCIGVTPSRPVTWPGRSQGETSLEPHHSHFIVVEGKDWGDEVQTMFSFVQTLSQDCPSVAVFAGGGNITLREMQANVEQGREMILIAASGRSTDAVLDVRAGSTSSAQAVEEIASKGRIVPFEIDSSPDQFTRLLESRISPA